MKGTYLLLACSALLVLAATALYLFTHSEAPVEIEQEPAADWRTSEGGSLSFRYPEALETTYIRAIDWPPTITMSDGTYACELGETEMGMTRESVLDGVTYCITTLVEGAAGSMYIEYDYVTEKNGKLLIASFTLKEVQCSNYNEPEMAACTAERESFDIDGLVGEILRSVEFK